MSRTIFSKNGRFEWDEDKDRLNKKIHGFSFNEILEIFDDPAFLEGYDLEHSGKKDRYYGIGCFSNSLYIIAFYTLRARIRIISARQADAFEQEEYNDYFKKIKY